MFSDDTPSQSINARSIGSIPLRPKPKQTKVGRKFSETDLIYALSSDLFDSNMA